MAERMRAWLIGGATAASLALGACATTSGGGGRHAEGGGRPVQVTRFHLDQPIAPGEIAIEPVDPRMAGSLEFRDYAAAVDAELQRLGFRPAPTIGKSELVATVDVRRGGREVPRRRGGVSFGVGVGGGSFGRGGGVGGGGEVGATVPVGGGVREVVGTELAVQIKRRSDGTMIWEGRARFEAPAAAPAAAPVPAVQRAAHALFAGFPGESGRTILVR